MTLREMVAQQLQEQVKCHAKVLHFYPEQTPESPMIVLSEAAHNDLLSLSGELIMTEYEIQVEIFSPRKSENDLLMADVKASMQKMGFRHHTQMDNPPLDGGAYTLARFRGHINNDGYVYMA